MTPTQLAARCEAAEASEQREMLELAFLAIHDLDPEAEAAGPLLTIAESFAAKLDAEAFESAAIMLAPEGMAIDLTINWIAAPARARILPLYEASKGRWLHRGSDPHWTANASTPALALAAAALKARA